MQRLGAARSQLQPQQSHQSQLNLQSGLPEAASLINEPQLPAQRQQPTTFECLVSFDRKRDRNLVVKWHHDERQEPIYQWIPELNKRSIAPQYRAFIAPVLSQFQLRQEERSESGANSTLSLVEAGFRLVRPTKELGGWSKNVFLFSEKKLSSPRATPSLTCQSCQPTNHRKVHLLGDLVPKRRFQVEKDDCLQ